MCPYCFVVVDKIPHWWNNDDGDDDGDCVRLPPPSRPLLLCPQRWSWAYNIQQRTQIINMKIRWKEWRNPFKYLCAVQHSDSTNDCKNKLTNLRILSTLLSVPRYFGSEVWLMYFSSKICSCFGKNTFGSVVPLVVFLYVHGLQWFKLQMRKVKW